jgi:hypothetical protein
LADALTALRAKLAGTKIFAIDLNSAEKSLPYGVGNRAADTRAGNLRIPPRGVVVLARQPAACPKVPTFNVDQKFFSYWDAEHPTTAVHRALGGLLFQALQQ